MDIWRLCISGAGLHARAVVKTEADHRPEMGAKIRAKASELAKAFRGTKIAHYEKWDFEHLPATTAAEPAFFESIADTFGKKTGVLDVGFGWNVKDSLRLDRAELLDAWSELEPLYRVLRSVLMIGGSSESCALPGIRQISRRTMKHDPDIYKGTAWYYSHFRPPYPDALVRVLRDTFGLDGSGRLLDLGCGPGPVAIRLAHLFDEVVAMDPEPEMLAEGRAAAERAGVSNIEWLRGGSERSLSPRLGQFRLVTMGNSFHWMDRQRTLDALYDLVANEGGIAVVGEGRADPCAASDAVARRYPRGRQKICWRSTAALGPGELINPKNFHQDLHQSLSIHRI